MPGSLSAYYQRWFERQSIDPESAKWRVLRIVLEVLLAADNPVSIHVLLYAVLIGSEPNADQSELEVYNRSLESCALASAGIESGRSLDVFAPFF